MLAAALACAPALAQDEYTPEDATPAPAPQTPAPAPAPSPRAPGESVPAPTGPNTIAVLQGLDKVTARISTIEAPLDEVSHFGTLEITPHTCFKTPPEETPESAAFLEIWEAKPGEPRKELFTGWMFASSPALSALEHPVYDVWVLDCKTASSAPAGNSG
ncbi:MAG TPA: DUF2155 domain-containing protein [Alphaproteobacteria bacterium]|nr:DUF2155 domain-containing protein [Alphaproteobacteria bacterium]